MPFEQLSLGANAMIFATAAGCVWIAGSKLAHYADAIAERTNLARAWLGLVFLATVTELPEIATTFTAAIAGNATLVLSNMFGGITLQTALLAVVDAAVVGGALTAYPRRTTHVLEAALLIVLLSLLLGICTTGDRAIVLGIGVGSILLALAYVISLRLLKFHQEHGDWQPVHMPAPKAVRSRRPARQQALSLRQLIFRSFAASAAILIGGVLLVQTADTIAVQSGLGASFVGVTFLAAATSLPELSTALSAARLGANSMAISNIFGSNLIMVALLLPADVLYRPGPLLQAAGKTEMLALIFGLLVTAVYLAGLLIRRKPQVLRMGIDSVCVLAIYFGSLVLLFNIR